MSHIQQQQNNYGFPNPLSQNSPLPIISKRAPTTVDYAPLATIWDYTTANEIFILTSIVSNVATWQLLSTSGSAGVFSSLVVSPGLSSLSALTQVGTANINATGAAATNIGRGTGAVNIGNSTGNIAMAGAITLTGSLHSTLSLTSDVGVVGLQLYATGDAGNGIATETSITNVINTTQGAGVLGILSTTANPGNNAGFIKIYVGTVVAYIPYWTNIAP